MPINEIYKVFRSSELSGEIPAIVSVTREYLLSKVVGKELLAQTPWAVLAPNKSGHWFEGAIFVGNTDISVTGSSPNCVTFKTPEDKKNEQIGHFLSVLDEAPILTNINGGIGPKLKIGVSDNYGQGEFDINEYHHLIIPKGLRENVKPNQNYSPKAVLIVIEREIFKNTPLSYFNSRVTLLTTALTPLK